MLRQHEHALMVSKKRGIGFMSLGCALEMNVFVILALHTRGAKRFI